MSITLCALYFCVAVIVLTGRLRPIDQELISYLVLCEYSQIRIELNSYFTIRFDSKWIQLCQSVLPFWLTVVAENNDKLSGFSMAKTIRFKISNKPTIQFD